LQLLKPNGRTTGRGRRALSACVGTGKTPVTSGRAEMCGGAGGAGEGGGATGLFDVEGGTGSNTFTATSGPSFALHTTLESGHLCLLARLRDLNFHPHATHWCSQGGSLAAFTASLSHSRLAAWLHFHARHRFSFWALLALRPPFWSSKKAM